MGHEHLVREALGTALVRLRCRTQRTWHIFQIRDEEVSADLYLNAIYITDIPICVEPSNKYRCVSTFL